MTKKLAYTLDEVVELTGLGKTLLNDEMRTGRLLRTKCRRRTMILATNLDAFLEALASRQGPTAPQD
jgi:hypothetical protein